MPKIEKSEYESTLLKSKDLEDDVVTTSITGYELIDLPQTGPTHSIKLKGYEKPMALNKTNLKAIIDLYGDETEAWTGKVIKLVKSMANNPQTGQDQEVIRIREPTKPKTKKE